jgi:hypothetical protein
MTASLSAFGRDKADMSFCSAKVCFDPKRTSCRGAKARICLGLSIVVYRPGATCSDAVEADSR